MIRAVLACGCDDLSHQARAKEDTVTKFDSRAALRSV